MKKKLGDRGEEIAAHYLCEQGYEILARNYHTRYGELDIICHKDEDVVIVEVKTRTSIKFGFPEEAVTPRKIGHLKKAALIYLGQNSGFFREIRFDVVTVFIDGNRVKINHIENAF